MTPEDARRLAALRALSASADPEARAALRQRAAEVCREWRAKRPAFPLLDDAARLLACLTPQPTAQQAVAEVAGMDPHRAANALRKLQAAGAVASVEGGLVPAGPCAVSLGVGEVQPGALVILDPPGALLRVSAVEWEDDLVFLRCGLSGVAWLFHAGESVTAWAPGERESAAA